MSAQKKEGMFRILASVPSPRCFGLQNLTLQFFEKLPPAVVSHFICTKWTDGEFGRRLDALNIGHSETWLGMFSRKLDWHNLRMTLECLVRLPLAWWHCIRIWYGFKPDVIYVANHHEVILLWPLLFMVRRKVVCHMHDPPPAITFQRMTFLVWKLVVGRFLCISENVRERVALLGRCIPPPEVIHNGVEIHPLEMPLTRGDLFRRQFDWPLDSVIVGITGQINPEKGHEDFLSAAATIHEACPNARFVIGGKQSGAFYESLQKRVGEMGMEHWVQFVGWLPASRDFFENIDVFVLASRHDEGFGLVVAEASERAIPVVVTRSGGATEVVEDGVSGFLVEKNTPSAIALCVIKFVKDSELRAQFGKAGRARVERYFNLQTQVEMFERFLRSVSQQ
jgi:glycosyltransferase involved in cell wall biosynthesis